MLGKIVVEFLAVTYCAVIVLTSPSIHTDQLFDNDAKVVRFVNNSNKTGKYSVIYELSNGIIHYETGSLSSDSSDRIHDIVEGTYWFVGPDNRSYEINYYADQDGFHPLIGPGSGVSFKLLQSSVG